MRGLLLAGAAAAVSMLGSSAFATDLPPMASPTARATPRAATYNWTGFYVGGNVGYSWGKWDTTGPVSTASPNVKGWLGGLQAGHNWQVDTNWLVGLEADIQITGEKASEDGGGATATDIAGTGNLAAFHTITTTSSSNEWKFPWFATFRGRVGALADPTFLIYGTGGLAVGHFKFSSQTTTVSQTFRGAVGTTTNPTTGLITTVGTGFDDSTTRWGWTLGGGVEKQFDRNWSAKIEYLYLSFGSRTFLAGTGSDTNVRLRDNILRIGLNRKFD